ncbi:hypothetical protein DXT87_10700 [Arthrobacter sp. AET 35A]|nr:hypothetical protein [Arthrobacter sp. AET 35A]
MLKRNIPRDDRAQSSSMKSSKPAALPTKCCRKMQLRRSRSRPSSGSQLTTLRRCAIGTVSDQRRATVHRQNTPTVHGASTARHTTATSTRRPTLPQ